MGDSKREIKNINGFNDIIGTPSNFTMFYEYGVRGLTDIDQSYEKNSEFLFVEGKNIKIDNQLHVNLGQYIHFDHLQSRLGNNSFVGVVGYKNDPYTLQKTYYMTSINIFKDLALDTIQIENGKQIKCKSVNINNLKPLTKKEYCIKTANICNSLGIK